MKWINVFQACTAAGVLVAGVLVAADGYAENCQATQSWGYQSSTGGECFGMGAFGSGNQGLSDAWISADLQASTDPFKTPSNATITGLDANQHAISGCSVNDTTTDGHSVAIESGCSSGDSIKWIVYYSSI